MIVFFRSFPQLPSSRKDKRPLDYNHELQTVGLSNILSGVCGGYTGE